MVSELQISKYKRQILDIIENNLTTIVIADVGMGKSTQIPKYLYEMGYKVIVTQPRRIACISLANRIGEELKNNSVSSYETAFESNKNDKTRILFNTDGFRLAIGLNDLDDSSVLIIDEIHEWSVNIEILLGWIKIVRKTSNKNFKLVLMSATARKEELINFFKEESVGVLELKGTNYPVERIFINNSLALEKTIIKYFKKNKNILCFQHGKKEINELIKSLKEKGINESNCKLIPLHGDLSYEEQIRVFKEYKLPKIIVATNIAQTSITVPDIDVVIDNGLVKVINVENGISILKSIESSQSDCDQRAGRVGRTKEGIYILCSEVPYKNRFEYNPPEITRVLLDSIVLRLYSYGIEIDDIELIHLPNKELIKKSKEILINLGAIDLNLESKNKLTNIGKQMVTLPLSSRPSRMIIEAINNYDSNVLDNVIKVASILESGSLLQFNKANYSEFSTEDRCDLLAEVDIFNFLENNNNLNFDKLGINTKNYLRCKEYYDKVNQIVQNLKSTKDYRDCYYDILKCITVAMIDNLFEIEEYSRVKIDKKSCINRYNYEFSAYIGVPRLIDTGYFNSLTIVNFCLAMDYEILNELYPDRISINIDYYQPNDDSDNPESFNAGILFLFDNHIQIDSYYNEELDKNNLYYSLILNRYIEDKKQQRLKEVEDVIEINGKKYKIEEEIKTRFEVYFDEYFCTYEDEKYELVKLIIYNIKISEEDLFNNLKDISDWKFKEEKIMFECLGKKSNNLNELRKIIINQKQKEIIEKKALKILGLKETNKNISRIYKGVTSIDEIDKLLKVFFSESVDSLDKNYSMFIGLLNKKGKNQIKFKFYKSRESAIVNTNEALKEYILGKLKLYKLPNNLNYVNSITYKEILNKLDNR